MRAAIAAGVVVSVAVAAAAQSPAPRPAPSATPAPAASAPPPAAAPKPPAEMGALHYFLGFWMCRGEVPASPRGPAHSTRTTVSINKDMGGMWLAGKVKELKGADTVVPLDGMLHMSWDPGPKQYVLIWVDNFGAYGTQTSSGWNGDTFEWSGEMAEGGKKVQVRDRFTRKGATQVVHASEANVDGTWVSLGEETCRKAGGAMKR